MTLKSLIPRLVLAPVPPLATAKVPLVILAAEWLCDAAAAPICASVTVWGLDLLLVCVVKSLEFALVPKAVLITLFCTGLVEVLLNAVSITVFVAPVAMPSNLTLS